MISTAVMLNQTAGQNLQLNLPTPSVWRYRVRSASLWECSGSIEFLGVLRKYQWGISSAAFRQLALAVDQETAVMLWQIVNICPNYLRMNNSFYLSTNH